MRFYAYFNFIYTVQEFFRLSFVISFKFHDYLKYYNLFSESLFLSINAEFDYFAVKFIPDYVFLFPNDLIFNLVASNFL